MNFNKTENTAVLGVFLALTGFIAAILLAYFSQITAAPIAEAAAESANKSLAAVLPPFKTKKQGCTQIAYSPLYGRRKHEPGGGFIIAVCMINSVFRKKNYFA